jgi:hypothetical protein
MSKTNVKVTLPLESSQGTVDAVQQALHPYTIQVEDRPEDDEAVRNFGTDQIELQLTTEDIYTVWEVLENLQRQIPSLSWEPKKKERTPEEMGKVRKKYGIRVPSDPFY